MLDMEVRRLTRETVREIPCCPGGLEVRGKKFKGDISRTVLWREEMLKLGMKGFISYQGGLARGFIEYMPAETAPFPIEAPGAAVLMCYHWIPKEEANEEEHLAQERRLIELVIAEAKGRYTGLATLGWDHPTHFPITMLTELGFRQVERADYIALMWLPFREGAIEPRLAPARFQPQDLSAQGLLAIESAWSSRCPYSIHHAARLEEAIAALPERYRKRVRHFPHLIDTREEALRCSRSPWDWDWLFVGGEEVAIHEFKGEELTQLLTDKAKGLP
jgi:hypothetical protein